MKSLDVWRRVRVGMCDKRFLSQAWCSWGWIQRQRWMWQSLQRLGACTKTPWAYPQPKTPWSTPTCNDQTQNLFMFTFILLNVWCLMWLLLNDCGTYRVRMLGGTCRSIRSSIWLQLPLWRCLVLSHPFFLVVVNSQRSVQVCSDVFSLMFDHQSSVDTHAHSHNEVVGHSIDRSQLNKTRKI